jgi:hypothetical protein
MAGITSRLQILEMVNRAEHFDAEGGGSIIRTIYCEPYTAHRTVVCALKGTVRVKPGGGDTWERVLPHNDPLYPQFYVTDVKVVPFSSAAILGAKTSKFSNGDDPTAGVKAALNNIDDFDFSNTPDSLDPATMLAGGEYVSESAISVGGVPLVSGHCGAFITATYRPLIFVDGLAGDEQQFDYVDPVWTPITKLTQLGRDLSFVAPNKLIVGSPVNLCGGVTDTATIPEVLWEFRCRRLLVPFVPTKTLSLMANKLNKGSMTIGNIEIPAECARMELPTIEQLMAPDGTKYYNISLCFTIRTLWTDYYKTTTTATLATGYPGWNYMLGIPSVLKVQASGMGYWPVGWKSGAFGAWGDFRGMYLYDTDTAAGIPNGIAPRMDWAPFRAGFKVGQ